MPSGAHFISGYSQPGLGGQVHPLLSARLLRLTSHFSRNSAATVSGRHGRKDPSGAGEPRLLAKNRLAMQSTSNAGKGGDRRHHPGCLHLARGPAHAGRQSHAQSTAAGTCSLVSSGPLEGLERLLHAVDRLACLLRGDGVPRRMAARRDLDVTATPQWLSSWSRSSHWFEVGPSTDAVLGLG